MALAFAAFAVYGSLLPFEWRRLDLGAAWEQFGNTFLFSPTGRISRSDVLANVLLFVPIGFCLAGARQVDRRGWMPLLRSALIVLLLSVAISFGAEFLQMFTSDRFPSGLDIVAQVVGTILGIVGWGAIGQELTNWIREALAAAPGDRLSRLLVIASAAWVFVNLAPFDITIDLGDLATRVRTGRISLVPFGNDLPWPRRAWDAVAQTVSAIPLGVLGVIVMQLRRRRGWPGALLLGVAIVIVVEFLQIFIRSHSADTGDAVLGSAGVAIGVWIGTRVVRVGPPVPSVTPSEGPSWLAVSMVVFWCGVLAAYHWLPYDFAVDYEGIRLKVTGISILPFAGYLRGSYLNALNDLLTKLALAVPLGLAASFVARDRRLAFLSVTVAWLIAALCLFGILEAGQFFLPTRSPDPTDVLVGVVGTLAGLRAGRWLQIGTGDSADSSGTPW